MVTLILIWASDGNTYPYMGITWCHYYPYMGITSQVVFKTLPGLKVTRLCLGVFLLTIHCASSVGYALCILRYLCAYLYYKEINVCTIWNVVPHTLFCIPNEGFITY